MYFASGIPLFADTHYSNNSNGFEKEMNSYIQRNINSLVGTEIKIKTGE